MFRIVRDRSLGVRPSRLDDFGLRAKLVRGGIGCSLAGGENTVWAGWTNLLSPFRLSRDDDSCRPVVMKNRNRRVRGILAVALVLCGASAFGRRASAESTEWWKAPGIRRTMELTPAQVAALDGIYRQSLPQRKRLRADLDRLEAQLARAMARGDDSALALIDAVEETRARRNTLRAVMLFGMYRVLTARQRQLLSRLSSSPSASVK